MPVWVVILIPLVFFIVFPLIWCLVMWINSNVSGWSRLAKHYRSDAEPNGQQWSGIQGKIGLVSYKGVLDCTTNETGMFLQPSMIFRFAHPRLFIPWEEWHDLKAQQYLWLSMVSARIGNPKVASVILQSKVFEGTEAARAKVAGQ